MIALSPQGTLYLPELGANPEATAIQAKLRAAFCQGSTQGLLHLGLSEMSGELAPSLSYWRGLARLYFSRLCTLPGLSEAKAAEVPACPAPRQELKNLATSAPPMLGAEYLYEETLSTLWRELDRAFRQELLKSGGTAQEFFESRGAVWSGVGKVCFHLAENKADAEAPFAFLATYSHRLSSQGKTQHLPLGRALQESAGEKSKGLLLKLLLPVQKAQSESPFLKGLVDAGDLFHPLAWTPEEAFRFLRDIPVFESSGIVVRVPDWWKARHPPRPQVSVTIGGKRESAVGLDAMLDFSIDVTLKGEKLSRKELTELLAGTGGLALIRGKWVEIDREKLK